MAERDLEKLLGGYATGTLTEEERRRLFEAALHDQTLFDALTREDALKEVLEDPTHRRRLLAALEAQRRASRRPFLALRGWLRRPANLALAGTVATAVIAAWIFVALERERSEPPSTDDLVMQGRPSAQQPVPHLDPATVEEARQSSTAGAKSDGGSATGMVPRPPAVPQPAQKKGTRAFSSAAPPAVSVQDRPLWLTSHSRPVEPGPARQLYYARRTPVPRFEPREPIESRDEETEREPGATKREPAEQTLGLESMANLEAGFAPGTLKPLGLRYSILKQDEEGVFEEGNPDGPFKADDVMRVTVEVNETGYLYVFRLGPQGEWLWISPSGPLGKGERESGGGVLRGKRYVIPGTGVLSLYGRPAVNKMILIYSRQPRRELQVFHPAVLEREEGDDKPSADLESLLSRARIETSALPLLVEQVQPDQPVGSQERAVYVVNPEAGRDAAIAIELTFPSS